MSKKTAAIWQPFSCMGAIQLYGTYSIVWGYSIVLGYSIVWGLFKKNIVKYPVSYKNVLVFARFGVP